MKAILINPFNRTVTAIDVDPTRIAEAIDARLIDAIPMPKHVIYVDDEGLYAQPQAFWRILGMAQSHIAGKGLLLGTRHGTGTDCTADARSVELVIEWRDPPTDDQMDVLKTITVTPLYLT